MQTAEIAEKLVPMYLGIEKKYFKDYSYASQKTQLRLLESRHGYKKSRATLGRWEKRLEEEGYIIRIQRIKKHPKYGMVFKSTVIYLSVKALHYARRLGHSVKEKIYRAIIRMKKRAPGFPSPAPKTVTPDSNSQHKTIGGLFQNLGFTDLDGFYKNHK